MKKLEKLLENDLPIAIRAEILYIIWDLTKDENYRKKAKEVYKKICFEIINDYKNFEQLERYQELKNYQSVDQG